MKSGPLFDDHETALLSVPLARITAVIFVLGGAGVLALAIALSPWSIDAGARLALVAVAVSFVLVAAHVTSVRLRFQGERFEVQRLWGTTRGSAGQFLGWRSGLFSEHAYLLRREDLKWVELPGLDWSESLNSDRYRWLFTYLPAVEAKGHEAVRRAPELPEGAARTLLERPLPSPPHGEFYGSAADLELARAARSVAKFRYVAARESLEGLIERLPQPSVATPYVFDALRSVGTKATAALLGRALTRSGRERTHLVRALAALATPAERPLLERLLDDEDRFVVHEAREALRRLGPQAPPASGPDREDQVLDQERTEE